METKEFKTRTIMMNRPASAKPDRWILGLDIGYSAVKGMSANMVYCFPSYARKVSPDQIVLKEAANSDIRYRDENGVWVVGELAYDEVNASEVMDSEKELYGRRRYYSPMYQVIARTGMAIGLCSNSFGSPTEKDIIVQAGLPPKYLDSDTQDVKEVLAGYHKFELQIGKNSVWQQFEFEVKEENVFVMPQPLGAMISASVDKNGKVIPESKKYFNSDLIVFDPGFGTCDEYSIHKGTSVGKGETFPNLGMREVFARTCKEIKETQNVELAIPELQSKLESGRIRVVDKKAMKSTPYYFKEILEDNCKRVCLDAIEQMKIIHNYFSDTDYIIATGGTYDAWSDIFTDTFKDMDLEIVSANANDTSLSNIFSNVRGYYYYRLNAS